MGKQNEIPPDGVCGRNTLTDTVNPNGSRFAGCRVEPTRVFQFRIQNVYVWHHFRDDFIGSPQRGPKFRIVDDRPRPG